MTFYATLQLIMICWLDLEVAFIFQSYFQVVKNGSKFVYQVLPLSLQHLQMVIQKWRHNQKREVLCLGFFNGSLKIPNYSSSSLIGFITIMPIGIRSFDICHHASLHGHTHSLTHIYTHTRTHSIKKYPSHLHSKQIDF